jgi:uncharacterized protein (DUF952 family)
MECCVSPVGKPRERWMSSTIPQPKRVEPVYKILRSSEAAAFISSGAFKGSPDDARDGFVHLSAGEQLGRTLAKHFAGEPGLFLVVLDTDCLDSALRWKPSTAGQLYPHLYRPLDISDVRAILPVPDERADWSPPSLVVEN